MESAKIACLGIIRHVCNFKAGMMTHYYADAGFLEVEGDFP